MLLCAVMLLTLLPAAALAALNTTASLTVNGTALVTDGAATANTVTGAVYDETTNTLTLSGLGGEWAAANPDIAAAHMGSDFTIRTDGCNYLKSITVTDGGLTLAGRGLISIVNGSNDSEYGVSVEGGLTINGPRAEISGFYYSGTGSKGVVADSLTVTGGSLAAYGDAAAIVCKTAPALANAVLAEGDTRNDNGCAPLASGTPLTNSAADGSFVSKPAVYISVAGAPVLLVDGIYDAVSKLTSYTAVDVSADAAGTNWSYTQSTNTLALNGYTGGAIFAQYMGENFKITLTGESVLPALGYEYDPLTWDNSGILIRDTPLTTISGTGSLRAEGTLAVIEGSLTVENASLAVGCGEGEGWYTTKAYDGIAMWNAVSAVCGYRSASAPTLTVSGTADVTALGYYNGVYINTAQQSLGHLFVSGGKLQGTGEGVNMGVQVEGNVVVSGGLLVGQGVLKDGYLNNGAYGVAASGGLTVSGGGTVQADGYNCGVSTNNNGAASPITVSGTGCLIATGRTILGENVPTAPAIEPDPSVAAENKYDFINVNSLPVVGTYGDAKCLIGGYAITSNVTGGTLTPKFTRAGAGVEITVAVQPDAGRILQAGTLKYNGTEIAAANGVYKFTMPAAAVALTATFEGGTETTTALTAPQTNPVYNGQPLAFSGTVGVTYNSGTNTVTDAAVTYTYAAAEAGQYSDVRPQNAGTYYVKGSFAGDAAYGASVSAPIAFIIETATPTVTLSNKTATYTRSAVTVNDAVIGGNVSDQDKPTGEVTTTYYTAYTDAAANTKTTTANSGAASEGGAPVNAGTYYAVATIAALGNYGAATSNIATVTINRKSVSTSGMVPYLLYDDFTYNGLPHTPEITVKHSTGGATLKRCTVNHNHNGTDCNGDYYLTYENNVNASTDANFARVIVHGIGNYTGTGTSNFIIDCFDITDKSAISSVTGGWLYDSMTKSGPVTVTFNGANGEKPTATAIGTVSSAAGGTYTTVNLSGVAMTGLNDQNYFYSELYTGVSTGVSVVITGVGLTVSDTKATAPALVAHLQNQGRIAVSAPVVTGMNEYSVWVRGTSALSAYVSSDPGQTGEHKWIGLLIGDFSVNGGAAADVTALSYSTDGTTYTALTAQDVTDSAAVGGTAKQLVLWMKTDEASSRSIWLKDAADRTVKLTVNFTAYSAPVVGGGSFTQALVTEILQGGSTTADNLDRLISAGKTLTVTGADGAKLVFDTASLKGIDSRTTGNITVKIEDVTKTYQATQEGKNVFSLTAESDGKAVTVFGGSVTVSLPYILKNGEKAEDVSVWYLASDGAMTEIPCTYDAKTGLATFTVTHFSEYVVGVNKWVNPFMDVKDSDWFYGDVEYACLNKLFEGTSPMTFAPRAAMTRGMLVTVLWRMEGKPAVTGANPFDDVASGKYYKNAVIWAAKNGIVGGYSAAAFGPEDNITREQLATILYNYAKYKGCDVSVGEDTNILSYNDVAQISEYALPAMQWVCGAGLIQGSDGNLLPKGSAQRCQVAAILHRFCVNE